MHQFDQQYYERFYADSQTRAVSPEEQFQQADFIAAYLRYLDVPVNSILDVGCGLGALLEQLHKQFPAARTQGVEFSDYLCRKYGWRQSSILDYEDEPYDLVVCNDVLGYLAKKKDCARAIHKLADLCRHALYLSVLTEDDLDVCDVAHTDMQQKLRPYQWYKKQLDQHFVAVGGGLFLKKPLQFAVWRLERC
ncbi:MAG: class I SAM-dependent methyltransferase [Pseudomonadota bacterium]